MPVNSEAVRRLLADWDFEALFIEELGWDRYSGSVDVAVDGERHSLRGIAEKRGMVAFVADAEEVPPPATRRAVEQAVAKKVHEHLIVFTNATRTEQIWQWVRREQGKPAAARDHRYLRGHTGEALVQKLDALSFDLAEEEHLTLLDVTQRVRAAFDVERVTRQFYERFQTEHDGFKQFITGLRSDREVEWYASIMLNRLMFVYFIQKKGFLDRDRDYLRHRLRRVQQAHGKDQFLTFYRHFLLRLFHEGLGQKRRGVELDELLGDVPYLNGGLFDVHALERDNPELNIRDHAFERLFDFFDSYQWHLDDRPLRADDEINPDVLGYVFERYVNRKEKGAYYTKDDVSRFMTAASVVPAYLDRLIAREQAVLDHLRELVAADPDGYIFESMRHGAGSPNGWTLDGEDPRVAKARLERLALTRDRLRAGVSSVDELITLNVDVFAIARDHLLSVEDSSVVSTAYKVLTDLTVLDPTCGSGAFLFAALNLLEPLYEACVQRMRQLLLDDEAGSASAHFDAVIDEIARHPNPSYFITKTVIANNLYGVDLLHEACEIAKLRLFLRLVSEVETSDELEPLPDIDFNIRSGNTLIGFATEDAARERATGTGQTMLDVGEHMADVVHRAEAAGRAFEEFRRAQATRDVDDVAARNAKRELAEALDALSAELDAMLVPDKSGGDLAAWRESRTPFHWFAEFYALMSQGGFDVVIGNPPYVARKNIDYEIEGFRTDGAPDIYANIVERSLCLAKPDGRFAMIVPLSLTFSRDFATLREVVRDTCAVSWFSSFGRIPDVLFSDDVRVRNTIHVARRGDGPAVTYTTQLHRWLTDYRRHLFQTIHYVECDPSVYNGLIPKSPTARVEGAFTSLLQRPHAVVDDLVRRGEHSLFFKQTAYNWLAFSMEEPPCYDSFGKRVPQSKVGTTHFADPEVRDMAFLLLNGKLMFAWWRMIGDDFDVTETSFKTFPFRPSSLQPEHRKALKPLVPRLVEAMEQNVAFKLNAGKRVGTYNLARCRSVTDESDRIFASALGVDVALEDIELLYAETVKTGFDAA